MSRPLHLRAIAFSINRWRRMTKAPRRWYWTLLVRAQVARYGSVTANGRCVINGGAGVVLGENVHFNGIQINGRGGVAIGDNFHSGAGCCVLSVNHDFDGGEALPYGRALIEKPVTIGDNVWLGDGVTVLPGAVIGEGAVIGAKSVVAGTIEPLAVAAGCPARIIRYRDAEHYQRLKAERRFS